MSFLTLIEVIKLTKMSFFNKKINVFTNIDNSAENKLKEKNKIEIPPSQIVAMITHFLVFIFKNSILIFIYCF